MSHIRKCSTRRSDDGMDEDSDDKDSKRKSRNLSEKKRRDQFNLLVNELSSMVASSGRKMDKSTVLKATIAFLKNHNEVTVRSRAHEIQEDWKPTFLTNEEFTHLILEAVDGFIIVFSTNGQIFYASESVTSLLGYLPCDLLGMTVYDLASDDEQNQLYNLLMGPSARDDASNPVTFACHIKRASADRKQHAEYELVHFTGYFRSENDQSNCDVTDRYVFIGTAKLQTPQLIKEMPLADGKSEFTSRHSLEWKFLFLDHRAPPIIGYLPFELLGTSGYDYYHADDLERVVSCHEALMAKGEGTSCFYRFLTKGQQWIWLQTRFYITYHQWNSKPEFVVCTHRVVSYVDVMKRGVKEDNCDLLQQWSTTSSKVHIDPSSECSSMSADSPTSKLTQNSLISTRGSTSSKMNMNMPQQQQLISQSTSTTCPTLTYTQPQQPQQHQQQQHQQQQQQYVIPVAAAPVIAANFGGSGAAILSPLPPVDAMPVSPVQSQIQADLQRKHAELQVMIGQQQAELRRVSEQLIMARLGILATSQETTPYSTVSSTTSIPGIPNVVVPAVTVPIINTQPQTMILQQIQMTNQQQQQQQQHQQQQNLYNNTTELTPEEK